MAQRPPSTDPLAGSFDPHAIAIAQRQYFQPGDETLEDTFRRVAGWVARPDGEEREHYQRLYYELMAEKRFCPGGRVLAGADTAHGNVLNCFVQDGAPAEPGTNAWVYGLAKKLALVTKVGGGNGLCLDPLPPKRTYRGTVGDLYVTLDPDHPDFDKVKSGTFMDLVHGTYATQGYRTLHVVTRDDAPAGLQPRRVGDSVDGIWDAASAMADDLLAGRDVLLDLSDLRAEGTPVHGSGGTSSGPSSFAVEVFDNFATWAKLGGAEFAGPVSTLRYVFSPTLRVIRQGGTRRGAGMATLSITHPDVRDFVTAKDLAREEAEGDISTFNISVLARDEFLREARDGGDAAVLRDIAEHAWATGEPGVIFIDRINEHNPMRAAYGDIKSTNPCVPADTWVHTQRGARRVRDLVGRDFCAVVDGVRYPVVSDGFFSTGVKPVYRVRTALGFEVRATGEHPFLRVLGEGLERRTEWTPLGELAPGDRLRHSDEREAGDWTGSGTAAEGWLLGLLAARGRFGADEDDAAVLELADLRVAGLADAAEASLHELGHPLRTLAWREGSHLVSGHLARLADRFGLGAEGNRRVNDAVEEAGAAFVRGYLRGLFDADGCVCQDEREARVRLDASDAATAVRLQRMLARLGVLARRDGASLEASGAHASAFHRRVGFGRADRRDALAGALEARPPLEAPSFDDTVVAVELDGEEEVYDVTVEHAHAFAANGLLAHNCGEIPLYPGEPCDLGAMNLAAYVQEKNVGLDGFDFATFEADVATCVRFLDNVLEVNRFALDDNREMSMKLRRLGLGVMGLADALIEMGYAYHSDAGRRAVHAMISALREASTRASEALAEERGAFPGADDADLERARRNVAVLTVAPTGTTSMLMGVSSGVEPVFAPFIYRKIGDSYAALVHPLFRELMDRHPPYPEYAADGGWDWDRVVQAVQDNHGSVQGLDFVPEEVRSVMVCAHDIAPEDHVRMQGTVQRAFDGGGARVANSISKTINLPNRASPQDVFDAYARAFDEDCKGITVYRDGSRQFQVLSTKAHKKDEAPAATEPVPAPPRGHEASAEGAAEPSSGPLPGEPLFDRPMRLEGFTDAVKLMQPDGERRGFYVTVNRQDGLPTEVFINSGKAGDEANADSEALGRVVSIALQYGVPAEALVRTLRGINGGMYGTYGGRMVASKADLIAVALENAGVENVLQRGAACPECGMPLRFEEGCSKCEGCGYSKCG